MTPKELSSRDIEDEADRAQRRELAEIKAAIRGERMCVSVASLPNDRWGDFIATFSDGTLWTCSLSSPRGTLWTRISAPEVEA